MFYSIYHAFIFDQPSNQIKKGNQNERGRERGRVSERKNKKKKLISQIENETEILWSFNLFSAKVKSRNMKMPKIIKASRRRGATATTAKSRRG